MIKREYPDTDATDADIEAMAQLCEYKAVRKTGVASAPTDPVDLGNLQRIVILETCIDLKSREPHSRGDASYREEHYPQLNWMRELKELYALFIGPQVPKFVDWEPEE